MSAVTEIAVRMGEIAVTQSPAELLVTVGLGSCIGLALVDQPRRIAGLAHIMLPEAVGACAAPRASSPRSPCPSSSRGPPRWARRGDR